MNQREFDQALEAADGMGVAPIHKEGDRAMSDITENGLLLLGILIEANATGQATMRVHELRAESGLSEDEFRRAETYLRSARHIDKTGGGDTAQVWATGTGIDFHATEMANRYPLSPLARRAAKFIMDEGKPGTDYIVFTEAICNGLGIDEDTYNATMQELADFQLAEGKISTQSDPFLGVILTPEGRLAVRHNFRREDTRSIRYVGAIFEGPVSQSNIQALAQAHHSTVEQTIEAATIDELPDILVTTIQSMVSAVKEELTAEQFAVYDRAAQQLEDEARAEHPCAPAIHRLIQKLALLGDLEGTLELGERSLKLAATLAPYVHLVSIYAVRLLDSL
jgi:hypothetical protein